MAIRNIKHQLEAKLTSRTGSLFSKPRGKLERKSYGDSGERLEISLRNLKVLDNSIAVVTADGVEIAQIPVHKGFGHIDNESRDPRTFVKLEADQTIEVHLDGTVVLSGKLNVD
jgi:hypothetical protein